MTIGIPRALFYWKRPHFFEEFFENLGEKVILSPKTNKDIVGMGVKVADPETCFSVKVLFGHILFLEGKVDMIFIPRLKTNEEKLEYCPKFFGMPDLAKILVKTPILTETFDSRKEKFQKTLERLGKRFKKDKSKIKEAINAALLKEEEYKEKEKKDFFRKIKSKKRKIIMISHPYNLYDDYVNIGMKKKIEDLGGEVIFVDEIPILEGKILNTEPEFHWEFGKEIMEKIEAILKYDLSSTPRSQSDFGGHKISGAIEISSFQCGCDAVLKEFVEREFKQNKIPFLYLMIDEQTGEAGIQTRLEAFWDTL